MHFSHRQRWLAAVMALLVLSPTAQARVSDTCQQQLARADAPGLSRLCTREVLTTFDQSFTNLQQSLAHASEQTESRYQEATVSLIKDGIAEYRSHQTRLNLHELDLARLNVVVLKQILALQTSLDQIDTDGAALETAQDMLQAGEEAVANAYKVAQEGHTSNRQSGIAALKSDFQGGRSARASRRNSIAQALAVQAQQRANNALANKHAEIIARHTDALQAANQQLADSKIAVMASEVGITADQAAVDRAAAQSTHWQSASRAVAAEAYVGSVNTAISATAAAQATAQKVANARQVLAEMAKGRLANLAPTSIPVLTDSDSQSAIADAYSYYNQQVVPTQTALDNLPADDIQGIATKTTELDTKLNTYANKVRYANNLVQNHLDNTLQAELETKNQALANANTTLEEARVASEQNDARVSALVAEIRDNQAIAANAAQSDADTAAQAQRRAAEAMVALQDAQATAVTSSARLEAAQQGVEDANADITATQGLLTEAEREAGIATSRDALVTEQLPRDIPAVRRFEIHDCTRSDKYEEGGWCGYIEPGLYERSGNSDVLQFSAKGAISRRQGKWLYGLLSDLSYVRSDGEITDDTFWVGGKVRYQLCPTNALYNETSLESKQRRGYKYLVSNITGIEHDYIRNPRYAVSAAMGLGVRQSKTTEDVVQTDFTQELRGQLSMGLTDSTSLDQLLAAEFGNFGESLTTKYSVTTITTKVSDNASLNYSLRMDHLSQVPEGTRKLDIVGKVGLRYDFF